MQEQDFLAAIVSAPDDRVPRLVYADWLDEQGDPRGEFIRVQCERETLADRDPRCRDLEDRERNLLAQFRNVWAMPVRKWGRVIEYHGGFVEDITVRAADFLQTGEELLGTSPIRRVKLTHLKPVLESFLKCRWLAGLKMLNLRDGRLGLAGLKQLLKAPWLEQIEGLDLSFNGLRASAFRELAACSKFKSLKSLAMSSCEATGAGLAALLEADWVANLERLELASNNLNGQDAARIAKCNQLGQLRELILDFNRDLSRTGIRQLLESDHLKSLRVLSLRDCSLDRDRSQGLVFSKNSSLPELVRLDLQTTWLDQEDCRQLSETDWLDGLIHLNLSHTYDEEEKFDPLFQPGRLPHLRTLWLNWNKLTPRIVNRLKSLGTSNLTDLNLGSEIQDEGVQILANSEAFANLNILSIRGKGITDKGGRALAESEMLNRITELRLTTTPGTEKWNKSPGISDEVKKSIQHRYGKHVCYFD